MMFKMIREQFEEYLSAFNSSEDKGAFFDRYYDPDAVFSHPPIGVFKGREEIVNYLNSGKNEGHDGVRETIKLREFISIEGKMAVEVDLEWNCFRDTDFLGPRKKGDIIHARCAGFFTFKENRIIHVELYVNQVPKP